MAKVFKPEIIDKLLCLDGPSVLKSEILLANLF